VTWAVYQENTVDVEGRGPSPAVHSSLELDTPRSRRIIHVCPAQQACSEQSEKHCYTTCERIPCMSRDVMAGGLCHRQVAHRGRAGAVVVTRTAELAWVIPARWGETARASSRRR
jgi:hypothetical protein